MGITRPVCGLHTSTFNLYLVSYFFTVKQWVLIVMYMYRRPLKQSSTLVPILFFFVIYPCVSVVIYTLVIFLSKTCSIKKAAYSKKSQICELERPQTFIAGISAPRVPGMKILKCFCCSQWAVKLAFLVANRKWRVTPTGLSKVVSDEEAKGGIIYYAHVIAGLTRKRLQHFSRYIHTRSSAFLTARVAS